MVRSKQTVTRNMWGEGCEAWELLASSALSVKHERMPPGTCEIRHYHAQAQQFFFVLSGVLTLEVSGERHDLNSHEGLEVMADARHQAINAGSDPVEFLVVSSPPTIGDRSEEG